MKQTTRVSIGGVAFNLDEDAFALLNSYMNKLRAHFASNDEANEIISDIEQRVSELLALRVPQGESVVSINDIEVILAIMGNPKDFGDGIEEGESAPPKVEMNETNSNFASKRLFRDLDMKIISGVSSGLGHYFRIDPVIIRIIWVALFFLGTSFGGRISLIVPAFYCILWIVIPKAVTFRDKLRMSGENPSIENIEYQRSETRRTYRGTSFVNFCVGVFKIFSGGIGILCLLILLVIIGFFIFLSFDNSILMLDNYLIYLGLNSLWFKVSTLLLGILPLLGIVWVIGKAILSSPFKRVDGFVLILSVVLWLGSASYLSYKTVHMGKAVSDRYTIKEEESIESSASTFYVRLGEEYKGAYLQPKGERNGSINIGHFTSKSAQFLYRDKDDVRQVCAVPSIYTRVDTTLSNIVVKTTSSRPRYSQIGVEEVEVNKKYYTINDSVLTINPLWFSNDEPYDFSDVTFTVLYPSYKKMDIQKIFRVVDLEKRDRERKARAVAAEKRKEDRKKAAANRAAAAAEKSAARAAAVAEKEAAKAAAAAEKAAAIAKKKELNAE